MYKFLFLVLLSWLLASCGDPGINLPRVEPEPGGVCDGESYHHLYPDLALPAGAGALDIFVSRDGLVFVAETALNRVEVLDINGSRRTDHGLGGLEVDSVRSVTVDALLNVAMVNGTRHIFLWNQLANLVDPDSILYDFRLQDTLTGEVDTVDYFTWRNRLHPDSTADAWCDAGHETAVAAADLAELLAVRDDTLDSNSPRLMDITSDRRNPGCLFATDSLDRIWEITLEPWAVALGSDPQNPQGYLWRKRDQRRIISFGTGFGYVDKPHRLAFDPDSSQLFYTLFAGTQNLFRVHRTQLFVTGGEDEYYPWYSYGTDVFAPETFLDPWDLVITSHNIYIADPARDAVVVFSRSGKFLTYAGAQVTCRDTTLWLPEILEGDTTWVQRDTTLLFYDFSELVNPLSVGYFIADPNDAQIPEMLFVLDADSTINRIVRFGREKAFN